MKHVACLLTALCTGIFLHAQERPKGQSAKGHKERVQYGTASFYANKFQGRPTASGTPYDKDRFTCANNSFPLGTWLKVTNLRNKRSVFVQVTDRLHHRNKRVVDLSRKAAAKLGYVHRGLARVKIEVIPENKLPANVNDR